MSPTSAPFGVLVVDDSTVTRAALCELIALAPGLRVLAEASTGEEAVRLARKLRPALITMDLNMPGMGGLEAIESIMRDRPAPLVVISERSSSASVDVNYEALARGALELIPKSSLFGGSEGRASRFAQHLHSIAMGAHVERDAHTDAALPRLKTDQRIRLVAIGASTGGPRAVAKLLAGLPAKLHAPVVIVQHMAEDFFDSFLRFLADASKQPVTRALNGEALKPGMVVVAPPRNELFVQKDLTVRLQPAPASALLSPTADTLFFSSATALGRNSIGILMSGMGDDGAQGLLRLRRAGATTLIQNRETCAVFGMPKAALELGAAEHALSPELLAQAVDALCLAPGRLG
jgi:two-component system, chemotaxis family, protein-glutamate methylesterase/glutaminase